MRESNPCARKNKKRLRMRGVFFKKKFLGLHQKSEKPRLGTKNRKLTPRLGTNPPFLPRKNSKHRYTASVAFSSKYKRILANENTQRNSYESFLSKCLHLRDRLFFISPLLKFYYEHHLQVKHTKSEHTVDNIGHVRIKTSSVCSGLILVSFMSA